MTKKIVILDDDAAHLILSERAIKKAVTEISIVKTTSAAEASKLAREAALVLLDYNLGKRNSLETLTEIRRGCSFAALPVIVYSTSQLSADIEESYRLGANCYLFKDSNPDEFLRCLGEAVKFFVLGPACPLTKP